MKKIAFYCRVSTSEQDKNATIETQLNKLREAYKDEKVVRVYQDICSGAYLQRPGLNQLREDARKGVFNVVSLYSLDRLSRKLGHQIALIEELEKQGVKIEVLGEKYENSPEGVLNRNIRGAFAEYERFRISQRMRDGKYRKAETEFVWGTAPYGYKIIRNHGKKCLAINEHEANVVREMFKIYLEEHSLGKTAQRLYDIGFRARTKRNGVRIPLSSFMISKMLENETYIGNFWFGKTFLVEPEKPVKENRKTILSSRKYRPREQWKLLKVPPIIDLATFKRAQEIKEAMARQSLKPTRNYLLQGLIKCVHCGYRFIGKMKSKSHRDEAPNGCHFIYICPKKAQRRRPNEPRCHSREVSTNRIDQEVWEYVRSLIQDKEKIKKAVKDWEKGREEKRSFHQKIYENLLAQKAEIKKKKSKILDLYTDEKYQKEDLDEKISELNSQQQYLEKQIKEVERDLAKIEETSVLEREIEQSCLEYQGIIENADFDLKKRILKRWVREINLPDEGGVVVKVRIPPPERSVGFKFSAEDNLQHRYTAVSMDTRLLPFEFEEVLSLPK